MLAALVLLGPVHAGQVERRLMVAAAGANASLEAWRAAPSVPPWPTCPGRIARLNEAIERERAAEAVRTLERLSESWARPGLCHWVPRARTLTAGLAFWPVEGVALEGAGRWLAAPDPRPEVR